MRKSRLTNIDIRSLTARSMSEDDLVRNVAEMGHLHGWILAHFRSVRIARKDGSFYYATPAAIDGEGFPDLCMVNPRQQRVMFIETKSQDGEVRKEQTDWLSALEATGKVEQGVWRPSDWLSGDIENCLSPKAER